MDDNFTTGWDEGSALEVEGAVELAFGCHTWVELGWMHEVEGSHSMVQE